MRLKCLFLFILPLFILGESKVNFQPIVYGIYNSQGGMWRSKQSPAYILGVGGEIKYNYKGLYASTSFTQNLYSMEEEPTDFTRSKGIAKPEEKANDGFYLQRSKAKIKYDINNFTFKIGKYSEKCGPGFSSILLSNKIPNYPQIGFEWEITDNIYFKYLHGKLRSTIRDSTYKDLSSLGQKYHIPEISRYIAAHRLTWDISTEITIGLTEAVIYGGRELDLNYLVPTVWYWASEHYLGDKDNVYMAADVSVNPLEGLELYGTFYIDEWRPEWTLKEKNRNWFAYQAGFSYKDIYLPEDKFKFEYIWTDHRVYRNLDPVDNFYSYGYPVGFWAGPHAQEIFANYSFKYRKNKFKFKYSYAKRGELTEKMLRDQYNSKIYKRFSGLTESRNIYNITVDRKIWKNLNIHLGLSRIIWNNANFDPFQPDETRVKDVTKTNITLGLLYNIDYKRFTEL